MPKKCCYLLRSSLAVQWIERGLGIVPTEFRVLVERLVEDAELKSDIQQLVEAKRGVTESGLLPGSPRIVALIEQELARWDARQVMLPIRAALERAVRRVVPGQFGGGMALDCVDTMPKRVEL